jgi:predicted N-acetyltransferase YhbS
MVVEPRAVPVSLPQPGTIRVREAQPDDWRECGRICYEAFRTVATQHGFPPDFPTVMAAAEPIRSLIAHPRIYGVVAESDGAIVGSSFLDERSIISAIGPVTVDPTAQDSGVGRALMGAMLARVTQQRAPGVRLVQIAYHNRSLSLYAKLGFDVRASFAAMYGTVGEDRLPGYTVRPAAPADQPACDALCTRVHGFARAGELSEAIAAGTARVVEHLGRIAGYSCKVEYWSHSVAETNEGLEAMVLDTGQIDAPGILVPVDNGELFRWALAHGLRMFFETNLMAVGIYQEPRGAYLPSVGY